jgi:hypothetical protein
MAEHTHIMTVTGIPVSVARRRDAASAAVHPLRRSVATFPPIIVPGVLKLTISAVQSVSGSPEPVVRISGQLRGRRQVAALVASLIDALDMLDDTDSDLEAEELASFCGPRDGLPGDPDDAEPSHGGEGWTWPAGGVGLRAQRGPRSGRQGGAA